MVGRGAARLLARGVILLWCVAVGLGCSTTPEDRGGEGRARLDTPCVFPFTYKGVNYRACTNRTDPDGFLWCSTRVNGNGRHMEGNFGYCSPGCPGLPLGPGDEDEFDNEVNTEEEEDLDLRSSSVYGRSCFSQGGYSGTCRADRFCKGVPFSFSRKCGWKYVCCKRAPNPRSSITSSRITRTTTRRTTRRTTARTTTPKPRQRPVAPLCGVEGATPFVFGGQEARPGQFPFMVSFVYTDTRIPENFCGGALIGPRHVLTAAHCFRGRQSSDWERGGLVDVRIGLNDLSSTEKAENSANIALVTIHPEYTEIAGGKEGVKNDLAIVTLDRDVRTPPVCLAGTADGRKKRGSKPVVIGFGKTVQSKHFGDQQQKLRFAYLEEISNSDCQDKYNNFYKNSRHRPRITREMMCAGNSEADACSGDSGSPLLYQNTNYRWMVGAVVSFGPSSCGNAAPGVYARVDTATDWILTMLGS